MRVAGLDVSTKAAHFVAWDGKSAVAHGEMDGRAGARYLHRLNVEVVYIEEIPWVRNAQTMRKLCEAVGCWKERCEAAGLRVETIPVAQWKALSIGQGNASKDTVCGIILASTDMPLGCTQHEYDACGIAIAGYQTEKLAGVLTS